MSSRKTVEVDELLRAEGDVLLTVSGDGFKVSLNVRWMDSGVIWGESGSRKCKALGLLAGCFLDFVAATFAQLSRPAGGECVTVWLLPLEPSDSLARSGFDVSGERTRSGGSFARKPVSFTESLTGLRDCSVFSGEFARAPTGPSSTRSPDESIRLGDETRAVSSFGMQIIVTDLLWDFLESPLP